MIQPDITKDYIVALKDFPDQAQLSISFSKQGKTEYFGLLKGQDGMENIFIPGNKQIRIRNLNGGTGGFGASLMINPDSDFALVVLSNCYPYHYLEKIVPVNKQVMLESRRI